MWSIGNHIHANSTGAGIERVARFGHGDRLELHGLGIGYLCRVNVERIVPAG